MTIAHRNLFSHVRYAPAKEVQGHGSMSYTPDGWQTGYLPNSLKRILSGLRGRQRSIPMIYSYATPIAWYDAELGDWVVPDVRYSVTTGRQQSYVSGLSIPADCGTDEYLRYVTGKMTYSRWDGIKPGPNFTLA